VHGEYFLFTATVSSGASFSFVDWSGCWWC